MTVVYADSVFVLNLAVDYLVLLLTARLAGIPLRRRRYLLAALLGGVYAVAVLVPGWDSLSGGPAKFGVGVLMAVIAFWGEAYPVRLALLMLVVSCGLAGCVMLGGGLAAGRPLFALTAAAALACGTLGWVFRAAARHGLGGELLPVRVCIGGRTVALTALRDNGNSLTAGGGQNSVLVVAPGMLHPLFSADVGRLLTKERLQAPAELPAQLAALEPSLFPQLLSFRAVGVSGGWLLAVRTDWIQIGGNRMEQVYVALAPTPLGAGYGALWGGAV